MARRLIVLLALTVVLSLGACDDGSEGGAGGGGGGDDGPLTKSKLTGACPAFMTVGVATTFNATIQNRGDEDWPVTYIGLDDDSNTFVVNSKTLDGKNAHSGAGAISYGDTPDATSSGRDANAPVFDVSGFRGLGAGEKAKLQVEVTPKKAGNTALDFTVWGARPRTAGREVPFDAPLQGCDEIAIQP